MVGKLSRKRKILNIISYIISSFAILFFVSFFVFIINKWSMLAYVYILFISGMVLGVLSLIIFIYLERTKKAYIETLEAIFKRYGLNYIGVPALHCLKKPPVDLDKKEFVSSYVAGSNKGNSYRREHLVYREKGKIIFQSVNVTYAYSGSSGESRSNKDLFSGRFYRIECPFKESFSLVITENKLHDGQGLNEIFFESIKAERKFKFFTNDEHIAFYYVTPTVIEKFLEFEKIHKGYLTIAITNGRLYAGWDYYYPFDFGEETTEKSLVHSIKRELKFVDCLVKLLNDLPKWWERNKEMTYEEYLKSKNSSKR